MPETEEIFKRQNHILDPKVITQDIHVFGIGTGGSHLVYSLSKMGFPMIHIYDFDKVEAHNVANQFYKQSDIGKFKVDALVESVIQFVPTTNLIIAHNERIDEQTVLEIHDNSIIIMAFDTLKARRMLWEKLKGKDMWVVDARMTGEMFRVISGKADNQDFIEKFEISLNPRGVVRAVCGEESIIYNTFSVVATISSVIKKIVKGEFSPFDVQNFHEISFSHINYQIIVD